MELCPTLEIGWRNGWILIGVLYLTYGVVLLVFPKEVVARLYDKSGRTRRQKLFIYGGGSLAFVFVSLISFTPLKTGSTVFIPGMTMFTFGLAGFVTALFNFKNAPRGQPVTRGLYRVSRHPQQVMFFVSFLGMELVIGSWLALFVQGVSSLFLHARILAEEKACLERYGDAYRDYMNRVPRYFLFV